MATHTLAEVRQAVSDAVATLPSWRASTYAFDWFGSDARTVAHRAFAVGLTASAPDPDVEQRQRRRSATPLREEAQVSVRWAWRLRGDAHVADQDEALAAADDVLQAVRRIRGLHVHYAGSTFGSVGEDSKAHLLGELRFRIHFNRQSE